MASRVKPLSDGARHERLTLAGAPIAAFFGGVAAPMFMLHPLAGALLAGAGCLCGVWIGPDLDQPGMTRNEWQLKKIPVIGSLLAWWFTLYSYLVNWEGAGIILKLPVIRWLARNVFCHRGISHWLVIGTLTRVAWLGLPLFILLGLTNRALIVNPVLLGLWMGGLFVSDMLHWLRDYYGLEI